MRRSDWALSEMMIRGTSLAAAIAFRPTWRSRFDPMWTGFVVCSQGTVGARLDGDGYPSAAEVTAVKQQASVSKTTNDGDAAEAL